MKKISIEVKPNCKNLKIEKLAENKYKIHLTEPAKNNKANIQLINFLADYFNISKSSINIKSGKTSQYKHVIIS